MQAEWLIQTRSPSVPPAQEELGHLLAAKTSLGLPLNPELWGLVLTEDRWGKCVTLTCTRGREQKQQNGQGSLFSWRIQHILPAVILLYQVPYLCFPSVLVPPPLISSQISSHPFPEIFLAVRGFFFL